jgi:hypothetical protein
MGVLVGLIVRCEFSPYAVQGELLGFDDISIYIRRSDNSKICRVAIVAGMTLEEV